MYSKGFTLIELSIVLVIIGLIVGGVLVGQDLIKAAEMRSVVSDIEQFKTAANTYRLKYNAIPGDHSSAETFFGAANTNNGNGNKIIEHYTTTDDSWLFWQHMALAGLIQGTYTGDHDVGGSLDATVGLNVPASKRTGVGYTIHYTNLAIQFGLSPPVNVVMVGKDNATNNATTFGGAFSPIEAQTIDSKYDDGSANTGSIRSYIAAAAHDTTGCTNGANPNHSYNADNPSALCNLAFSYKP